MIVVVLSAKLHVILTGVNRMWQVCAPPGHSLPANPATRAPISFLAWACPAVILVKCFRSAVLDPPGHQMQIIVSSFPYQTDSGSNTCASVCLLTHFGVWIGTAPCSFFKVVPRLISTCWCGHSCHLIR